MKRFNTPTLETERLVLRKFKEDDAEDMFLIYSDIDMNQFLPWFPFRSLDETKQYLHDVVFGEYRKEIAYCYALALKTDQKPIGYVILHHIDELSACGELGYGIRKEFWNQGIVTEACGTLLRRLKADGFQRVIATHDVNNIASGKVIQKLGMTYIRSYEEQWLPKNIEVEFALYEIDLESYSGEN